MTKLYITDYEIDLSLIVDNLPSLRKLHYKFPFNSDLNKLKNLSNLSSLSICGDFVPNTISITESVINEIHASGVANKFIMSIRLQIYLF